MGTEFDKIRIRSGNVLVRVRLDVFAPGLIVEKEAATLRPLLVLYGEILPYLKDLTHHHFSF